MSYPPRKTYSLLVVDDEPAAIRSLKRIFFDKDYEIHCASNGMEALEFLAGRHIDLAIVDLKMPKMDGLTLLENIKNQYPHIEVIILTGHGGVAEAVAAIKKGATDFLEKPFSPEGIKLRVGQLHQIWSLKAENQSLREQTEFRFNYPKLIGQSARMMALKEAISRVGPSDVSILIQGETGTGKELVARAIHHHSPRSKQAFVPVDCAAISETVIESELFGHAKGAFTDARAPGLGLIRSADRGTLFLDEIGELSLGIQAKLLRTIQEREVRPVGETRNHPVNLRVLAATNRDLAQEVEKGRFRNDLYYRLNVMELHSPSLKDRGGDIPVLIRHFMERYITPASPVECISPAALGVLEEYHWPGNVRELENVIRRAMAIGRNTKILIEDLPEHFQNDITSRTPISLENTGDSMADHEKRAILNALHTSDGNRKKAALQLGIGEATLYRKLKKYGLNQ
jgi:DNA-binding NtrC family response regulator